MKRRLYGLASTVIGLCLALMAVELLGIAWLQIGDGKYTPARELFDRSRNSFVQDPNNPPGCRHADTLFPHPYLGHVHHANAPCGYRHVNNVGLFGEDFPSIKRTDRYTILLTGGSVAAHLGQVDPPPAPRYLEDELNARFESPNGQPFLVLNGADGGWKQPQQFILVGIHARVLDAVITLDGYNEYSFFRNWRLSERLERPFTNYIEVSPHADEAGPADKAIASLSGWLARSIANTDWLSHSHAAWLGVRALASIAQRQPDTGSPHRTTLRSLFALPPEVLDDRGKTRALELDLYQHYIRAIEAIARDRELKSAYFLQPIPAFGKMLTEEERRAVGDIGYRDNYRNMVADMMSLRARGIPIFDLGTVFEGETSTIYADEIHVRRRGAESPGNKLLAAAIAARVGETWGLKPKR